MINRKELANAIRILSIDAIQKANSGHPGMPMGMADIAEVLWRDFLIHNPNNPFWFNRDRFILSNGHGSMLLYSLLHLTGYNLSINDIKNFRQLNSKTPGHPEYEKNINGIETTTGPLGQGLANGVGFAIAERILSKKFNKPNYKIINHKTYIFIGDGCLMEGISHEVCSLAGTLKLNKIIVFYDNNNISIDGNIKEWYNEDVKKRFESYGWNVIDKINGHNSEEIKYAIKKAHKSKNKPNLIICKTIIGYGSPNKAGNSEVHGAPLGKKEIYNTRLLLKWKFPEFIIPKNIYLKWDAKEKGKKLENKWNLLVKKYSKKYPELYIEYKRCLNKKLPINFNKNIDKFIKDTQLIFKNIATRKSSQNTLEFLGKILPELIGGSADLTPSNLSNWSGSISFNNNSYGNYIHYGVREFGMSAITNGIALHGGLLPYSATFLIFFEYAHNAIRMASLMNLHIIFIYTHDSIGLGEDGPTHQPIETLSNLRMIPNLYVWRPCDEVETAIAWKYAIKEQKPIALILTRQNVKQQIRNLKQINNVYKGGYIIKECNNFPDVIFISTGSELDITIKSSKKLKKIGINVRVVSLPSTNVFEIQNKKYRKKILPKIIKNRIVIEASFKGYWYKYTGLYGKIIGMKNFGESGPAEKLFNKFGFTINNIIKKTKKMLIKNYSNNDI
ncbi:transketolase [Enterobacterales bacterium endosymbiont of Anomoneura mori]|uniref:transketolase n=1 Tax=Enterobacterales bacterium endosymbiont of Anomoneura mori TaxID=3132096 RepID=UPI00399CAD2B